MAQSVEAFRNAFKIPELKQRILFTLMLLAILRVGTHVPTPGIDGGALAEFMGQTAGGLLGIADMFAGGAFANATIFALGIMPYITASIIMSLLVQAVPALERIQRQGPEGQKKITEYTRYGTIGLCIVQSITMAIMVQNFSRQSPTPIVLNPGLPFYLTCIISFTTGTAFIMWLGEQISEYGVGNGISLIIFVNIISRLPNAVMRLGRQIGHTINVIEVGVLIVLMVLVIAGAIMVTTGQRRIPVQYPRQVRGRQVFGGGRNYFPLRVNQAGVIPIIFASSILMLPGFLRPAVQGTPFQRLYDIFLDYNSAGYLLLYVGLIVFFTFFYTAITFNPVQIADDLKKYGGVIMGVRPGKATAEYLNRVMVRITLVGAFFLAAVALIPNLINAALGIPDPMITSFFGGTSLLIIVGVALDTVHQIEQHLVMHHYDGFMKSGKMPGRRR